MRTKKVIKKVTTPNDKKQTITKKNKIPNGPIFVGEVKNKNTKMIAKTTNDKIKIKRLTIKILYAISNKKYPKI